MQKGHTEYKLLCRSDRVDETRVGERVILYHRDTGSGIVLNPSGSRIWDALSIPSTVGAIADTLSQAHASVSREQIEQDVAGYIRALKEQQLVIDSD